MKIKLAIFLIIGVFFSTFAGSVANSETMIYKSIDNTLTIPKKSDLIGTYTVKSDKKSFISLNNDGTYNLTINVCNDYLTLSGTYELRDSKLILKNNINDYDDLNNNKELNFTIIDSNKIKSDENLVCIPQETLFEK